jgi:hypothetical protein
VEIWGQIASGEVDCAGARRASLLEMRLVWNHLLVEDAHDQQFAGLDEVKHNVLANLKAT